MARCHVFRAGPPQHANDPGGIYSRVIGRTFDLPRQSVGSRVIEVSGQRGGKISSRARILQVPRP